MLPQTRPAAITVHDHDYRQVDFSEGQLLGERINLAVTISTLDTALDCVTQLELDCAQPDPASDRGTDCL